MKKLLFVAAFLFVFGMTADAQTVSKMKQPVPDNTSQTARIGGIDRDAMKQNEIKLNRTAGLVITDEDKRRIDALKARQLRKDN